MSDTTWDLKALAGAGVLLASISRITRGGVPWVIIPGQGAVAAKVVSQVGLAALRQAQAQNATVVVVCEAGDPSLPIILGVIATAKEAGPKPLAAVVDGERVELTGRDEVVLRCGKATIILTKAGKILLRGTHILSRSSRMNRIKGASVQIN